MSNNHNQPNAPGINTNDGHVKATPRLPPRTANIGEGFASGNQNDIITFETAPRPSEKVKDSQAIFNANGSENNLSYHFPPNSNTNTSLPPYYTGVEVDPVQINTSNTQYNERPEANPYFLFFGKFSSTLVQNMKPNLVGHYDVSGGFLNQQPSNIYNIPDIPKNYTMFKSTMSSYNTGNNDPLNEQNIMDEFTTDKIIYDASSCPVNWRVFGPIRDKVLDITENGLGGGAGGTGTDLSFNNYFFKQPEMPVDCSFNFFPGNATSGTYDRLRIHWDKPLNRKAGTAYSNNGNRFFYKSLNPVENWLPQFIELVFDISGGLNGRTFCKDLFGNFVHEYEVGQGNGGVLDNQMAQPQKYKAYAFLSANNTAVNLQATTNPQQNNITTQYGSNAGYGNMETTITDHFAPGNNSGNYAGGKPKLNDVVLGGNYDIAIYYRNNTKINTDSSLSPNDLYYNKHNVCLLKNIVFGRPGFPEPPTGMDIWSDSVTERYYLGGEGPSTKDSQNVSPPGVGLNLPWTNTSIIKVGYDCSLNMTYNSGSSTTHRVQVGGANSQSNNLVFNNFPIKYNLDASYQPVNMSDTKRFWPVGGNVPNSGVAPALQDYIKMIDIAAGGNGRDHPEFKYEITKYNVINDTIDDTLNPPDIRKVPFSSLPITRVIPITSRSSCNLTNYVDYENVLYPVAGDPSSTSTTNFTMKKLIYIDNGSGYNLSSQVPINAQRSRSRNVPTTYTTFIQYFDTLFLAPEKTVGGQKIKEILCLTSGSNIFKQLANFGEPKTGTITGQTYGDLIEPDAYLGSSMTSVPFISKVELDFQTDTGSGANPLTPVNWGVGAYQTSTIPNTAELVGWDTSFTLSNSSNVSQTIFHKQTPHDFTFRVSPTFDIAETDPEITFSNKRGYYLGFDISNVKIEIDMNPSSSGQGANPYKDSALLTPSYRQHRVILTHEVAKRSGASSSTSKQFIFRLATKPDDITVSNIVFSNFDFNVNTQVSQAVLFTDFFGVKRLPLTGNNNSDNQFGGNGLELNVEFDLNSISENWLPHTSDSDYNDNLAYIEYVVGPGVYPNVNASGDLITVKRDRFDWGKVMGTSSLNNQATTYSVRSFFEIHEGVTALTVDSGTSSYVYSRKATDNGDPLFGLKNHKFYYSNNVTRNDIIIENGSSLQGRSDGFTTLQECKDFSTFVPYKNPGTATRKELFWDYTFPIHSVNQTNQELPLEIDDRLKLLHIYTYQPGQQPPLNARTCQTTDYPWGGPPRTNNPPGHSQGGFNLINLEKLLQNPSGGLLSGFPTWYKHDKDLPNEQAMWCNGSFVGCLSANTNLPLIENPYIDYTSYYNSPGIYGDYTARQTRGIDIPNTGVTMNISSGNYPSAIGAPTSGVNITSKKVKWLLFEVTDLPVDSNGTIRSFQVKLERKTSSGGWVSMIVSNNYHMFYCERDPVGAQPSYIVNIGQGQAPPGVPPSSTSHLLSLNWTTWLNCSVARGNTTATTINHISYANGIGGSGNGCNRRVNGGQTMIAPFCETFGQTTGMRKFLLIGLFEDKARLVTGQCSRITII